MQQSRLKINMIDPDHAEKICREITSDLPEYFGIPEANERYAKEIPKKTSFVATIDAETVGLIALEFPFENNANIYWLAVKRKFHGKKVGSHLIKYAEDYCRKQHYQSLTVETLSPKNSDENYLKTYQFYLKLGFQPLFELNTYGAQFLMIYMQKLL